MGEVNVNFTSTFTKTFRSDKKYFGQTELIGLSVRMTDRP